MLSTVVIIFVKLLLKESSSFPEVPCQHNAIVLNETTGQKTTASTNLGSASVRLQYGSYGLLEIYTNWGWREVCYNYQSDDKVNAICRATGYSQLIQVSYILTNNAAGYDNVRCDYYGTSLYHCTGTQHTTHCHDKLYIQCGEVTTSDPNNETSTSYSWYGRPSGVRLVDGGEPWKGRVELLVNGAWGTICDDGFDNRDAQVICHMLGYPRNGIAYGSARFGQGHGSILLDDLACNGYEDDISYCRSRGWYNHNCRHSEDVGVSCSDYTTTDSSYEATTFEYNETTHQFGTEDLTTIGYDETTPTHKLGYRGHIPVRLTYGDSGYLEVYHNGEWGQVCYNYGIWYHLDSVCVDINYSRVSIAYNRNYGILDGLSCPANLYNHSGIDECMGQFHKLYCSPKIYIYCVLNTTESPDETTTETTTSVQGIRLVGGSYPWEGRVELYHNGQWGTVCDDDFDIQDAKVICSMLGYDRYGNIDAYQSAYFGRGNGPIMLDDLTCSGYESEISQCSRGWYRNNCDHSEDAGVSCNSSSTETTVFSLTTEPHLTSFSVWSYVTRRLDFQGHVPVRLNGSSGFLEVFYSGHWGHVCYYGFMGSLDAVCGILGYDRNSYVTYRRNYDYALLEQLRCPSYSYYDNGIDDCIGRFWVDTVCYDKVYLYCGESFTTEITGETTYRTTTDWITVQTNCNSTIPADVVFVVDESGSVGSDNFDKTRRSIIDTIRNLKIQYDFIRIGVMTFDDHASTVFDLNSYPGNQYNMINRVSSMSYSSGGTDIAEALRHACNMMFTSSHGDRSNIDNYLVLLTDGQSDVNAAQRIATSCKAAGTRIISVGIGNSIDENMLRTVAYSSDYYLSTNYSDLSHLLPKLVTTAVSCGGLDKTDANHVTVNCQESNWYIKIRLPPLEQKYPDFRDSDIYLGTHSCTGYRSGDYLIFSEEYTTCKTNKTTTRDAVVYTNTLVYAVHDPVHHFIVREYRFKVGVECDMSKVESGNNNINNNHGQIEQQTLAGTGHFRVQLKFYSDSSYQHEFTGFPPSYMIGSNVYVKAETPIHDYDVKMRLSDCYTKPTASSSDVYLYYLIRNGCPADPSAKITSQSTHETRFYFQDFEYANYPNGMYVNCNATFCRSNDYSPACDPTCSHRKRKGHHRVDDIYIGPIGIAGTEMEIKFIRDDRMDPMPISAQDQTSKIQSSGPTPGLVVGIVVVAVAMVIVFLAVLVYRRKKRNHTRQSTVI